VKKLALLLIPAALLVSGCGDDSEYKTKLSYYESCISSESNAYINGVQIYNPNTGGVYTPFEYATARCEQFRP
jgi:hypothetical protein